MKRLFSIILSAMLMTSTVIVTSTPILGATDLTISNVSTYPTTVSPNGNFTLTFTLTNQTAGDLTNLFIKIDSTEYFIKDSGSIAPLADLSGAPKTYSVLMKRVGGTETSIPVLFTYDQGSHTDIIAINASVNDSTPSTPVDTSQYKPGFILSDATFPVIYQGAENSVSINLKNTSNYQAKNITMTPDLTALQSMDIRMDAANFAPSAVSIESGKNLDFTMNFIVDDTVKEGNYPIPLTINYSNAYNDVFSQTITTYLRVIKDSLKSSPITVVLSNTEPSTVKSGDSVKLTFTMTNNEKKISSPHIEIVEMPSAFTLIDGNNIKDYQFLADYSSTYFDATYYIADNTPTGWYSFKILYSYLTDKGHRLNRESSGNIYINGSTTGTAEVAIEKLTYPSSVTQDIPFKASFQITNTGTKEIKNIRISLNDNPVFIPKTNSLIQVKTLASGESSNVTFEMVASGETLMDRNYPITFNVDYSYDKASEQINESIDQILGIYVNTVEKDSVGTKGVPKIIIDQYNVEPMIVDAGSEFNLGITFLNAHKDQTIYNIKAFLTATETSATTQSNIFIPVNSSNTFFIDEISPKGTVEKTIRLYAMPDAQPKTYTIQVNFEYEDSEGTQLSATELVGVNVTQPSKVEMSDFTLPTDMMAGESIPVYFDVYNTGKVKVYNLIIKAEGNFNMDPMSKYIGNFEPGYQDYFDGYLMAFEPGLVEGKIILAYDDPSGERIEMSKEFSINVNEAWIDPGMDGEFYPDGGEYPIDPGMNEQGGFRWYYAVIPLLVLIGIIVTILLLKKRKAKKEGMVFDED